MLTELPVLMNAMPGTTPPVVVLFGATRVRLAPDPLPLNENVPDVTMVVAQAPSSVRAITLVPVHVSVRSPLPGTAIATGQVTVRQGNTLLRAGTLRAGQTTLVINGLRRGVHVLTVSYSGDAAHAGSSTTVTVTAK